MSTDILSLWDLLDEYAMSDGGSSSSSSPSSVNLIIYNGLAGCSGGQKISEEDEETIGAVTVANLNDTDGDGTENGQIDRDDQSVSISGDHPPGRNEVDLMQLVLKKPDPDKGGNVTLRLVSGNVKLWTDPTKETEVTLNGGAVQYPTSELDKTLWIEALSASASLRDIVLQLEYQGRIDTVKATAVWVTKTARSPWHIRQAADGFPNNPVPGPGNDLPDLTEQDLIDYINKSYENGEWAGYRAADGSRYGFGTMQEENGGGDDEMIGGRILYEFKIAPPGAEELDVVFDVTRQVQYRDYCIFNGSGTLTPCGSDEFPWLRSPVDDNELPNDDAYADGEQNTPVNRHLYSYDAPGTSIQAETNAFYIRRNTFKEWVRVQVNNASFPAWPNSQEQVRGSRASPKYDWHLIHYLKRDSSGKWVEDNANPSYNTPVFSGTGNGTINVTLLANAITEGFTATYSLADLKWTLDGTSSDPVTDTQDPAPEDTEWTLTVAGKITVVITQGATAFANGDEFKFSVFKSTATGGKENEIDEGYIDVTDGP